MAETAVRERSPVVLLIEGDASLRGALRGALEREGFSVTETATGVAGVDAAIGGHPDLVLVDASLPDIDGYEVATRLRVRGVTAPIVALTDKDPHDRGLSLTAGCDGSVEKPFDPARLPKQLREFLAGKREKLKTADEKRFLREYAQGLVEKLESKLQELTRTNERLTAIDRFKTEFMQSVSHELSTPLTPIVGYLKILKSKKLGELNERQEKVLDSMLQSTERLSRVLDNLVDFANLEIGQTVIRRRPMDVAAMLHAVVEDAKSAARVRRVTITEYAPAGVRPFVGDEAKLRQALANLLENAIKFGPNGAQILLQADADEAGVTLSVYDQGAGVPAAEQDKIFEPFFHAARAGEAERAPGAGLGLPVARKIVEAHGGRIWLESPPHEQPATASAEFQGSRFAMFLPWPPADASPPG